MLAFRIAKAKVAGSNPVFRSNLSPRNYGSFRGVSLSVVGAIQSLVGQFVGQFGRRGCRCRTIRQRVPSWKRRGTAPDTFVMHLIDLDRAAVEAVIEAMSAIKKNPPMTYDEVLDTLHARGLPKSASALRRK
jgi:hypothetical protein